MLEGISTGGYGAYKLEKGKTYYFGMGMGKSASKVVFQAEILADVVSIKQVKIDKSVAFYTPIDFIRINTEQIIKINITSQNVGEEKEK